MRNIYRIKIDDNDPTIMDEDEILEDLYEEIHKLKKEVSNLIDIILNINDDKNLIKF